MGINQRKFTEEQIQRANNIDLIAYANSRGYELKRISNNAYKIPGYGGLFISGDGSKWNWFSRDKGGGAIQFVMEMQDLTWVEAVKELLDIKGVELPVVARSKCQDTKGDMVLPEKNDTYKHVFAYLIKTRCIDASVVSEFVEKKMIYEDRYRNCVFVGHDEAGNAKYASRRSTSTLGSDFRADVLNSDKSVPFLREGTSKTVYVFEAPIDLMSYLSILRDREVKDFDHHMIALGGVSDKALEGFLTRYTDTKNIVLCLDNDDAGDTACISFNEKYHDRYKIMRHTPIGKDFNEDLMTMRSSVMAREPPFSYGNTLLEGEEELEQE